MPKDTLVLIFTRNPELGKVKTRLAQGVGNENALEIYKTLLHHTKDVVLKVDSTCRVGYSVKVRENDIWDSSVFQKFQQEGNDLGERMHHAFTKAFQDGFSKVLIIGSDLYDLQPEHVNKAFDALHTHQVVIGPAQDGGYYLLGMSTPIKSVFYNKQWGTDTVFKETLADLTNYKVHHLEMLNDIDYAEDLAPYPVFSQYLIENK